MSKQIFPQSAYNLICYFVNSILAEMRLLLTVQCGESNKSGTSDVSTKHWGMHGDAYKIYTVLWVVHSDILIIEKATRCSGIPQILSCCRGALSVLIFKLYFLEIR